MAVLLSTAVRTTLRIPDSTLHPGPTEHLRFRTTANRPYHTGRSHSQMPANALTVLGLTLSIRAKPQNHMWRHRLALLPLMGFMSRHPHRLPTWGLPAMSALTPHQTSPLPSCHISLVSHLYTLVLRPHASFGSPPTPITNAARVQATRAAGPSPPGPERQLIVTPPGEQQSQVSLRPSPAEPGRPAAAEPAASPGPPVNAAQPAATLDETLGREGERTDTSTPPARESPAGDRALSGPESRSQDPGASPISGQGVPRARITSREPAASASAPGTPQATAVTPMETDTDGRARPSPDTPMEIDTEVTTEPATEPPGRAIALCATASDAPAEATSAPGP
ncbi:hypothetical protein MMYC01_206504 [Madurella mycetomatis]|uniref:Uncharacterized protein n=1 Tax=Madurella mycetomatis TaxID=100816 RepID=A0A175W4A1_9PEZI|nr:hypothetical protein MMYC01_206504 [Madurella mycetomatis]